MAPELAPSAIRPSGMPVEKLKLEPRTDVDASIAKTHDQRRSRKRTDIRFSPISRPQPSLAPHSRSNFRDRRLCANCVTSAVSHTESAMRLLPLALAVTTLVAWNAAVSADAPTSTTSIALHCPRVIDTDAGKLLGETTIIIENDRIKEVRGGHAD